MEPIIDGGTIGQFSGMVFEGIFYVITIVFILFSLSIVYHWFTYGIHKSKVVILLAVYLGVSSLLFIGMSLALNSV